MRYGLLPRVILAARRSAIERACRLEPVPRWRLHADPVVYGDYLYICRDSGVVSCYKAATGERQYQERLGAGNSGFTASLIAADGKIYATSEDGDIYVIKPGPNFAFWRRMPWEK